MKRNQELVEKIQQKAKEGLSIGEIANKFGISRTSVLYWTNDQYREKAKSRNREISYKKYKEGQSWADRNPKKYRAWFRRYQKERYENDINFRLRMQKANRERMARIQQERKEFKANS